MLYPLLPRLTLASFALPSWGQGRALCFFSLARYYVAAAQSAYIQYDRGALLSQSSL